MKRLTCGCMAALLALLGLALGGCRGEEGAGRGDIPPGFVAPSEPQTGGRIVQGMLGEPSNLIATLSTDASSHAVADQIYVSPLRYDRNIMLEPYAARSFEVLDGGRRLRFALREGIRWFDGRPLTAEDVEFTYKLMIDPKTPTAYAEDFLAVKQFRLTGPYSFEVTYDQPFSRALLTWAGHILPKHVLEGQDLLNTPQSRNPVGAGPYRLKEWAPGSRVDLAVNPDYFEGRAYVDEVTYRIIPDDATQFLELKAGNLDMMGLSPQQYLFQTGGETWERNWRKYKYLSFSYTYMGFNLDRPLFADRRVRQAVACALDKEEIVRGALLGLGVPAIGPYKPGTWVYNDRIRQYPFDPEKAKALLAEAGWRDTDGDGVLDKDGRPFAFTILTNQGNSQRIKAATIIQYRLGAVGMKVEIRTVEWAAFIKEFIDKGRFDAVILGWNILQEPDIYDVWHSSKAKPGGLNFGGFRNAEADALLEKGRRLLDPADRKPLYDRFQEILHEEQPYCFLYVPMALPILHAKIQGVEPAPAGIDYNFIRWWVPRVLQ